MSIMLRNNGQFRAEVQLRSTFLDLSKDLDIDVGKTDPKQNTTQGRPVSNIVEARFLGIGWIQRD